MPRQIVETAQSVLGAVASVAIDYPIGKAQYLPFLYQ